MPQPALRAIQQALKAFGKGICHYEAERVSVAIQCRQWARHHQRHVLRQPSPVFQGCGIAASGRPYLPPFRCQA